MADEMPVCDVLCEAMEYLTKLGSNLRSRSESLKEKKIRKEKLKNAHAVQKAASKVLLICELSKKSLENVENGVKKVLQLVDAAQKSTKNGGNTSNTVKSAPKVMKEVFINGTKYKLKIPQNISLQHYNSVTVMAKSMPKGMLNKYPVYFDCKLYKLRQKKSSKDCNEPCNDENEEQESGEKSRKKKKSDPVSSDEPCVQTNRSDKDHDCGRNQDEDHNLENEDRAKMDNPSKINKSSESLEMCNSNEKNERVASEENQSSKKLQPDKKHRSDSYCKENLSKKYKKLKIIEDSSDSEKEKCNESSPHSQKVDSSCNEKDKFKESSHDIDKETDASVIDLNSDDDVNSNKPSAETDHEVEVESDKNIVNNESVNNEVESGDSQPSKPLIKCVNISKLLKPGVIEEKENSVSIAKNSKSITKLTAGLYHKIPQKEKTDKTLNVYEARKAIRRKAVAEFRPKKFSIDLPRLPKLSNEFLLKHDLKRITQNGKVVLELNDGENSESRIEQQKKKKSSHSRDSSDEDISDKGFSASEAKNALLNDSDNESPSHRQLNRENVKDSLLHHSSNEKEDGDVSATEVSTEKCVPEISNVPVHKVTENEDNSIEKYTNELQSEIQKLSKNDTEQLASEDQDKELAKSSLLNDSSDGTPSKKANGKNDTTPSRRKHIMESMHAKKMLLTYSSSSDTEDEQLKDVMKNIKEDLLKTVGSKNVAKKRVKKKLLSSSDSDESIKKKKKVAESAEAETKSGDEKAADDSEKHKSGADQTDSDDVSKSRAKKMGRSKPSGSSSPNSDVQNDKDIEGLTNLNSLNQKHRRRGSESEEADKTSKNKVLKVKLTPLVTGEGLLEAPNSSDGASDAESGPEDELPTVTLTGLNGGGAEHLAKDDLLEESESDSSKDKSSQNVKKEDDSDADNVKAKRRKGNTISSDSEAGSSRKKEMAREKMSDFEDSETESSEPKVKRSKRKKIVDSEASEGSSNEDSKKKRRRIKQIDDSEGSGSDTENEGKSKHGRKNIRKVMGKNQLEEATKKAAREEKERVARIAERQKLYNNLEFDESGKPDEVVLDKVVLDFDPETKEPLIEVDRGLVKKLKPHQANGIKFMWDACFESVKRIKKDKGSGCILAHCMGLGKTLQVVSLTHTLLIHSDLTKVNRVLVVCPLSTVLNWVNEFRMWLKHAETDYEVDVYELSRHKQNSERAFQLSQWYQHGGVCVLGYEMFRNLSADNVKKFKKKMLKQFQESLVDPGPDLVVCDEGHLLKNEKTSLSQSMNRVKTLRRIVLTGTPLQNNLKEYYCMVQFVKPNLLGKYNEYLNRFVNPITNGQYTDSTEHDIRVMKRRSHVLHKMLDGAVQRRDYGVLAPFLPPKHEYVLFITLTEVQIKLYQHYLDNYSRRPLAGKSSGFLFPDFQSLQRIWTHPLVLKYNSERYEIMQQKKREREEEDSEGSLVDFIDDDSTPDETSTEESSDELSDVSDDSRKKSKKKKSSKKGKTKDSKVSTRRGTRANPVEMEEMLSDPDILEVRNENPTEWWIKLVEEDELEDMRNSHKLVLLFEILRQCEAIGDKLLVFSQSLYSLDLIEHFLGKVDEATQEGRVDEKLGGHVGSWSPGIDYFRLDGSTSCENRSIWCKNFNREDNPRARLFLISTRAGGLGINLVAANRVVIFDVSWNPSHDVQSIFRVYRFGQKKPCYIYRFLAMGTMEEKIYERQVTKQAISKRVIDEQQIDRHYAENDLAELYKFEPRPPAPRPVPLVPKDRFFAEMLKEHEAVIYKFHEHDSLLENKEEETLSEEERKAAWEDFENEKNRPPPSPFPSWPMHNGMVPNLLAQQQQQLAYAALAQMLRKDMPNLSDENIRNMLPIIYSTNPGMFGGYDYGLMQKMTDIYKYAQPGMMNPAMMNPMNAGGGTGSMGGGTSGLQYEPPWQRQQQQQQQMRLQQILQQNQMGAKFYAGGLGSRDPVAMALQQQRAREIMLSNHAASSSAAARPRGRPPLTPRLPATAAPHDVVNLDSD